MPRLTAPPLPIRVHRRRSARLLHYALAYRGGWATIFLLTLATSAASLLQPWPMQVLVDQVLGGRPAPPGLRSVFRWLPGAGDRHGLIGWVAASGLILFLLNSAFDVALTWAWVRVGQGMVYDLAADLFAAVQRRTLVFHSRHPVGDSMARVTGDSWCVHSLLDTLLFTPLHALIMGAGMVVLMLRLSVPLTLLALAVVPLITLSSLLIGRRLRAAAHAQREIETAIESHVQQTLTGIPVVQAFAQEEREQQRLYQFTRQALRAVGRNTLIGSFAGLFTGLIGTLGTAAVVWAGARQVLHGPLSVGTLLVFLAYLGSLQAQFNALVGVYTALQSAGAGIDRVSEVLEAAPEVAQRPGAEPAGAASSGRATGHVRFQDVTFGYDEGRPVLKDVSLDVRAGETVAIVGPTGAGKSTLMGMVLRFFDPWSGRVTLDGRDLRDLRLRGPDGVRGQVALVLQEPFLFPLTVADNIAYGRPDATRADVVAAAKAANAHTFIERMEQGYDTVLGERGATLSGGERQRVSIARAILKDAPVLILDEPTSALDAQTEQLILQALQRLTRGRTTFIIAHRLSTIRSADRIVVLDDGRVAETGTHAELLARGGLYARLHASQTGEPTAADDGGRTCGAVAAAVSAAVPAASGARG